MGRRYPGRNPAQGQPTTSGTTYGQTWRSNTSPGVIEQRRSGSAARHGLDPNSAERFKREEAAITNMRFSCHPSQIVRSDQGFTCSYPLETMLVWMVYTPSHMVRARISAGIAASRGNQRAWGRNKRHTMLFHPTAHLETLPANCLEAACGRGVRPRSPSPNPPSSRTHPPLLHVPRYRD